MKLRKVLIERAMPKGIMTTITEIPESADLQVGNVISLDDKDTKWTIVKVYDVPNRREIGTHGTGMQ